jgi:hypothetical protein
MNLKLFTIALLVAFVSAVPKKGTKGTKGGKVGLNSPPPPGGP